MFRSQLFDHPQGTVFRAQCCYYLLCLFASSSCLFGMWLYVVYVCSCLMYLSVGVVSQPNIPQTSTSGTHTHRQHTATYQINNWTTQTSREVVTALSTEDGPPEDGQTIVTETCRVLIDVFYKHFLTTQCFKCECECVLKRVHELV